MRGVMHKAAGYTIANAPDVHARTIGLLQAVGMMNMAVLHEIAGRRQGLAVAAAQAHTARAAVVDVTGNKALVLTGLAIVGNVRIEMLAQVAQNSRGRLAYAFVSQ